MRLLERRVLPNEAKSIRRDVQAMAGRISSGDRLSLSDTGRAVEALQRHLKAVGVLAGPVSGTFDDATRQAVLAFQKAKGIQQSGIVGPKTLRALRKHNLFVKDGFETSARLGQRGSDVLSAERKLAKLGFRTGKVDGIFDRDTLEAVRRYRKADHEVPDEGNASGKVFYRELRRASKRYEHAPWRRREIGHLGRHRRLDELTERLAGKGGGLGLSDKGRAVLNVERHLEAAGYELGKPNASFGSRTEAAVRAFQRASKLPETGRVDAKTWAKLRAALFAAKEGTSPAQREGERGGAVLRTEKLLKRLGYKVGKVDGFFSDATERAVERFQRKRHRKVTGAVKEGTLSAIRKAVRRKEGAGFAGRVLRLARSQLGVREKPLGSNRQRYSAFFGRPPEPWCADFVSWLYTKAGKKLNIPYTPTLLQTFKNNGTYNRNNPKPGEIVIYDWSPSSGVPAEHTGIVEKVYRRNGQLWIQTIEGNYGDRVQRRNIAVSSSTIRGFGTAR